MKKTLSFVLALSVAVSLFAGMTLTVSAETMENESDSENVMTLNEFVSQFDNDASSDALSDLYANFTSGYDEDGNVTGSVFDYDENNVDTSLNVLSDEDYPDAFDLRHVGDDVTVTYNEQTKKNDITGGLSYVTSVKFQNPWGTCWAFGICAASESSILSELGLGTEYVENDNIDLSEHHLAWFAKNHLPAIGEEGYGINYVAGQDGEGIWYFSGTSNSSMEGGTPFFGTSVFASGIGVVTEDFAPYYGKNKQVMVKRNTTADTSVYTEKYLYYDSEEAWEAETDENLKANYTLFCYSGKDDWSLDESLRFNQSYALEESSILPTATPIVDTEKGTVTLNEDGINAIKSELTAGRAVEMAFHADNSNPNEEASSNTARYINSNWAHYTWDGASANHSVCIVGWDDDYDASNFGQEHPAKYNAYGLVVYKLKGSSQELEYAQEADGTIYLFYKDDAGTIHKYSTTSKEIEVAREEDGSVSQPAGNGAWIVKNSWGASTNDFPNKNTWGADGSGYFYVSYYDTSLSMLETFDFAVTDEEKQDSDYTLISEYDFMTASDATKSDAYAPTMMANVFEADEDMEVEAVSCETTTPGTSVYYGICLLDDDEDYPSGDDEIIMNEEPVTYKYGGYHRVELDKPVFISEGQKYALIVMEYYPTVNDLGKEVINYSLCANIAYSKEFAELRGASDYNVGVVNPGESYILTYGYNSDKLIATDFYEYISNVTSLEQAAQYMQFDNFSIKAYGKPVSKDAFSDISDCSDYVKSAIEWAADEKIVNGYEDGTFKPSDDCTRLQMIIMLWRMYGKPEPQSIDSALKFTDTQSLSNGAKKAIAWAVEQGIVKGFSDGTFRPSDKVTREQTVIMLWRLAGSSDVDVSSIEFTDIADLSATGKKAIAWAVKYGITSGIKQADGTYKFNPSDACQRQHAAIFIYRYESVVNIYS